jgi:hypothetical protein
VEVLACELGDARGLGRRRLLLMTARPLPLLLLLLLLPAVPAVRAAAGAVALVRLTIDGSRLRSPRAGRAAGGGGECGVGWARAGSARPAAAAAATGGEAAAAGAAGAGAAVCMMGSGVRGAGGSVRDSAQDDAFGVVVAEGETILDAPTGRGRGVSRDAPRRGGLEIT